MPEFKTEVTHGLGRDQAVDRLKEFVNQVQGQYERQLDAADGSWAGNVLDFSLKVSGVSVTGQLVVEETHARVAGELPLIALPVRGMIERQIAQQLQTALG